MSETAYESLSALMDNEVEDLELRRLLKQYADQPELRDKWARYQLVSGALSSNFSTDTDTELSKQIAQAIENEPHHQKTIGAPAPNSDAWRFLKPMGSAAIAASVAFLVVFGAQRVSLSGTDFSSPLQFADQSDPPSFQVTQSKPGNDRAPAHNSTYGAARLASTESQVTGIEAARVNNDDLRAVAQSVSMKPIENIDLYLQQHARNAALSGVGGSGFAKTAAFKIEQ